MADHSTSGTLTALFDVFDSLSQLGSALTETQWKTATDLPGWTVQDNLSHLVAIERVLQGHAPTQHRAVDLSVTKNPIGEMNEHEVDARRGLSGAQVLAEWNDIVSQRHATLSQADEAYFAQSAMTPTGPGTLADFLSIRVLDCWLHEQDMRRTAMAPGHLGGPAAEHTIDRLIRTLPIVVGKRAATPEGATVIVEITGPVQRTVVVTVTGGRAALVSGVPDGSPVVARLSLATEAFVVLATGRGGPDHPAVTGRWAVTGDEALGRRIVEHLNMMI
jgi:uncharacterized protein (TIGR03083 family)